MLLTDIIYQIIINAMGDIMKKSALIILTVLVLTLFAGCGEEQTAEKKDVSEQKSQDIPPISIEEEIIEPDIINNEKADIKPEPDETTKEIEERMQEELADENKAIPLEIRELMEKSETITNYKYFSSDGEYFVKDDRIHIIFSENKGDLRDNTFHNEVLIDRSKKKAYAWCTDSTYCGPNKAKVFWEINYKDYNFMTPTQLLQSLSNAEIINEGTTCESRKCNEIEFNDDADGITKRMWILTYNPIVWKVKWYDASKEKEFVELYQSIAFFRVKDEDIRIPTDYEMLVK